MDGVENVVPVPIDVPPLTAVNQESVPLDVAPKLTVPVPHLLPGAVPEIVGAAFTVSSTILEVVDPQLLVIIHLYL